MIEVKITMHGGTRELGMIRIENLEDSSDPELGNYSIEFGVDTGQGFAVISRHIELFPRKKYNVLGLLTQALATLEEKDLTLDCDPDAPRAPGPPGDASVPRGLAWALRRALQ